MSFDEFVAEVGRRAGFSREEAERTSIAVLVDELPTEALTQGRRR